MINEILVREGVAAAAERIDVGPVPHPLIRRAARQRTRRLRVGVAAAAVAAATTGVVVVTASSHAPGRDVASPPVATRSDGPGAATHAGAAPGPVSATMHVDAAMKYPYATVAALVRAPQTSTIVVGTIGRVDYQSVDGLAMTTYEVNVLQALRGAPGATITVHEDGGYLPASQINAETQEKFPGSTPTLDPGSFVDVPFEGAAHPSSGEQVLLFLMNDPNAGETGDYVGVMSAFSRFDHTTGASYARAAVVDGMEGSARIDVVKSLLS